MWTAGVTTALAHPQQQRPFWTPTEPNKGQCGGKSRDDEAAFDVDVISQGPTLDTTPPFPMPAMAYKHSSAGSITLVAGGNISAASSTESFKSIPPSPLPYEPQGLDVTDARSIFDEDSIDPALRHSTYLSPCNLDLEQGIQRSTSTRTGNPPSKKEPDNTEEDPNVVGFESKEDPLDPQNWTFLRKCAITFILAGLTFSTTFTSSVFSAAIPATSKLFSLSTTVMTLGTSLNLLGWTVGPIVWGPFSELYGRRPPLVIGVGGMCLMQVGVGVAQNSYTIFLCRFFGGVLGVAPLCVVGGALADFWDPVQRGVAVGIYAMCTFIGPVAAPISGGYIAQSHLGWRWTQYISVILIGFFWSVAVVFLPETCHAQILQAKAKRIRFETKNWAVHAPADEKRITIRIVVERYLTRPFRMIRQEPILCSLCLYIGLTYGILYLFLTSYPISFEKERGWSQVCQCNLSYYPLLCSPIQCSDHFNIEPDRSDRAKPASHSWPSPSASS